MFVLPIWSSFNFNPKKKQFTPNDPTSGHWNHQSAVIALLRRKAFALIELGSYSALGIKAIGVHIYIYIFKHIYIYIVICLYLRAEHVVYTVQLHLWHWKNLRVAFDLIKIHPKQVLIIESLPSGDSGWWKTLLDSLFAKTLIKGSDLLPGHCMHLITASPFLEFMEISWRSPANLRFATKSQQKSPSFL